MRAASCRNRHRRQPRRLGRIAFRGTFDFNFQINELSAHLRGTTLVVDTFTRFTDGSGRTDFWEEEGMRR